MTEVAPPLASEVQVGVFQDFPTDDVLELIKHDILRNPDKNTDFLRSTLVDTELHRVDDETGALVGFGVLKERKSTIGPVGEVKYMGVAAHVRGRGIGSLVLCSIEASCQDRGIGVLDVLPEGHRAQQFYEKNGFMWASGIMSMMRKVL